MGGLSVNGFFIVFQIGIQCSELSNYGRNLISSMEIGRFFKKIIHPNTMASSIIRIYICLIRNG